MMLLGVLRGALLRGTPIRGRGFMLRFISLFRKYYSKISYALATIIILFMTGLGIYQLAFRYLAGHTLLWASDVSVFCITTVAGLVLPPLWLDHDHLTMDLISKKLSPKGNYILDCFIDLTGCVMSIALAYAGYLAVVQHIGYKTSVLRYDDSLKYVFVLYTGVMLTVTTAMSFMERIIKHRRGEELNGK